MIVYLTAGLYFTCLDCFLLGMLCCAKKKILSADRKELRLERDLRTSSSRGLLWWELLLPDCSTKSRVRIQSLSSQDKPELLREQPVSPSELPGAV